MTGLETIEPARSVTRQQAPSLEIASVFMSVKSLLLSLCHMVELSNDQSMVVLDDQSCMTFVVIFKLPMDIEDGRSFAG